jgi:hypothetical protein
MIKTYYIVGYIIKNDKIKLILVNDKKVKFKTMFMIDEGVVCHYYSKEENWYKFTSVLFGVKDLVLLYCLEHEVPYCPEMYLDKYISFDVKRKKWIKASKENIRNLKVNYKLLKDIVSSNLDTNFHLIENVVKELVKVA